MTSSPYAERLGALCTRLRERRLAAWWLPSADPHLSEYLPPRWRGSAWLSGFSGSVGQLVVAPHAAALFVDGRYVLQAQAEMAGTGIAVVQTAGPRAADEALLGWLRQQLPQGARIGVDAQVLAWSSAQTLRPAIAELGLTLAPEADLLDTIWPDRPTLPRSLLHEYPLPEAGESRRDKLARLRAEMQAQGATHHLVSALDEIAWLLNLRGDDVDFNPVFLAHALLDAHRLHLFVGAGRLAPALQQRLAEDGVRVHDYEDLAPTLASLGAGTRLLLDPARVTLGTVQAVPDAVTRLPAGNPAQLLKSRRNAAQAQDLRATMAQDGAALCEFMAELAQRLGRPGPPPTELLLHDAVTTARARRPGFRGPSFATIAGVGPHAAMPHHVPTPTTARPLQAPDLLLIDSGGHYVGGTTDITRVWALGTPSAAQRRDYTLVLKGLIALSSLRFPRGTLAPMLDAIARVPLWREGLDYGHGTGHGVGHYLNVHEGPQLFAQTLPQPDTALQPGMVISIEPGLYRAGQWGVRLENLVLCVPAPEASAQGFGDFLAFETLSLCPLDQTCINPDLLDATERRWLDDYHARVRTTLQPLLKGDALAWLLHRTQPLP